jgi:hypothetical protein
MDCSKDNSDEMNCMLVILPPSYRRKLPPTKSITDIVNVTVNFHLAKIYNIEELDLSFSAAFKLSTVWNDDCLHFNNLKDNQARNNPHEIVDAVTNIYKH